MENILDTRKQRSYTPSRRKQRLINSMGLFQIEEAAKLGPKLTAARVTHPGTKETREFGLETPKIFTEIDQFEKFKKEETTAGDILSSILAQEAYEKEAREKEAKERALKEIGRDGRFIAYDDGTVMDTRSGLMWAAKDNGENIKVKCKLPRAIVKIIGEAVIRTGGCIRRMSWRVCMIRLKLISLPMDYLGSDVHLTELIRLTCDFLWASETRGYQAASFNFLEGLRLWTSKSIYFTYRVLPVRSGK
jgi:hypothetical protein